MLCWLPNDADGEDVNAVQSDRVDYHLRVGAVQCRHNVVGNEGVPVDPPIPPGDPPIQDVKPGSIEKKRSLITLCYDWGNCPFLNIGRYSCYVCESLKEFDGSIGIDDRAQLKQFERLWRNTKNVRNREQLVGVSLPFVKIVSTDDGTEIRFEVVNIVPCYDALRNKLGDDNVITCQGETCTIPAGSIFDGVPSKNKTVECQIKGNDIPGDVSPAGIKDSINKTVKNGKKPGETFEEALEREHKDTHRHEKGHAITSCLLCEMFECVMRQNPQFDQFLNWWFPTDVSGNNFGLVRAQKKYHESTGAGMAPPKAAKKAVWETVTAESTVPIGGRAIDNCRKTVFGSADKETALKNTTDCETWVDERSFGLPA